jgi:ArsR family transcriptional regulator, arsenate/arsenite/antimonite-responsive transcriptional repressor
MGAVFLPARLLERPADVTRLARLFHALSDETRLRIVGKLLAGEQCVCNLTDALDAGQSRLSFHLKALKDAGIVTDRREGRWVHYALNPEVLLEIRNFVGSVREGAARCC